MRKAVIAAVRFYKHFFSYGNPPRCKYYPSCSDYSIIAVNRYGVVYGILKSIWRIMRCNPFSKGGVDIP